VHALAFPFDVARQADVHGEQLRHLDPHRGTFLMSDERFSRVLFDIIAQCAEKS
jgi:hypothetical protein